jgi:hypothetical protein
MSVMAAFKSSEITKTAVEPMIQLWENVWNLMKSLPKYTPLPWVWLDMAWMSQTSSYPEKVLNKISAGKSSKYTTRIREMMWVQEIYSQAELENMKQRLKDAKRPEVIEGMYGVPWYASNC